MVGELVPIQEVVVDLLSIQEAVVDLLLNLEVVEDLVWKLEEVLYPWETQWRDCSICASLADVVCELVPVAAYAGTAAAVQKLNLPLRVLKHYTASSGRLYDQYIGHLRGGG